MYDDVPITRKLQKNLKTVFINHIGTLSIMSKVINKLYIFSLTN